MDTSDSDTSSADTSSAGADTSNVDTSSAGADTSNVDTSSASADTLLRLKYFSDIPRTSGRTPDVQLRVRDATLCIIGHLAPNLGECPDVFLLLQVKYFSDILRTSGQTPDVRLCTMATAFLHYRTTSAQLG